MKILIIASYFPKPFNRVMGIWALQQAKAFKNIGIEPIVISPTPYVPKIIAFNQKLRNYSNISYMVEDDGIKIFYPKTLRYSQLNKIYDKFPALEAFPILMSINKLVDKIIKEEKIDLLYCHHPLIEGYVGTILKRKYKLPLVVVEHSLTDINRALKNNLRRKYYKKVLDECDIAIAVSSRVKREMEKFYYDKRSEKIKVVLNGAESYDVLNQAQALEEQSRDNKLNNVIKIISVGALTERKGHLYLIYALKELMEKGINNFECNIIGDGPLREQLDRVTKKLNLEDRVKILGQRPHNEVIQKMKSSDIFVLPSWDEPFGIVFIEAMQIGLPVIGTLNEGISDIIRNRENGVLVEKKNYKELAAAIEFLMKDSNARKTIAKNGYESVRQLTWENNVRKNMEIFNYILNNVKR